MSLCQYYAGSHVAVRDECISAGSNQPQDQLTELLQELGTIEAQQEKLRDAVKHNKGIVVHPRHEVS